MDFILHLWDCFLLFFAAPIYYGEVVHRHCSRYENWLYRTLWSKLSEREREREKKAALELYSDEYHSSKDFSCHFPFLFFKTMTFFTLKVFNRFSTMAFFSLEFFQRFLDCEFFSSFFQSRQWGSRKASSTHTTLTPMSRPRGRRSWHWSFNRSVKDRRTHLPRSSTVL